MSADNGSILVRDRRGKFVPATALALQELKAPEIGKNIFVNPGNGMPPLIQMQATAISFWAIHINADGKADSGRLSHENQVVLERFRAAGQRGLPLLLENGIHNVKITGECIAANDNKLILIGWDLSSWDLSLWDGPPIAAAKIKESRLMTAFIHNHKMLALVPRVMPLPQSGAMVSALSSEGENPRLDFVKLHSDFPHMRFGDAASPGNKLLVKAGEEMTKRERALRDLGMKAIEFSGERPHGIQLSPDQRHITMAMI